ncbi:hypothetical protein HLH26_19210 [Gluconacetobacter sp. 1b LMG 1731]|uniref:Uncharacterized protein n=1 Tax=Gluconacetobacter dulcium TaxID=2729096 RepID=A0A7W4IPG7_9PROT|nr:hypothetical protein [Gluconacetobacter dulcium]MBB2166614.1 hypothetical protein [Gluconacetobacter dulcium]MBB2195725.1 hypothetical protein [Gluconacetobacter dulcium]
MMQLIATTDARDITPLAYRGQRVVELWSEFSGLFEKLSGATGRGLLAEPEDHGNGRIDWYGMPGQDHPQAERVARFGQLRAEIEQAATRQADRLSRTEKDLLALLPQVFAIPDETYIRSGANGPLLVGWGHQAVTQKLARIDIMGEGRAPPPPEAPPPPPVAERMDILPPPTPPAPPRLPGAWREWAVLLGMLGGMALLIWLLAHLGGVLVPWLCLHPSLPLWLLLLLALLLLGLLASRLPWRAWHDLLRVRRVGALGGTLQVVLCWGDLNDLDLHVICPDGRRIYFKNRTHGGGHLLHDANAQRDGAPPPTRRPVETIVWRAGPPPGFYTVVVDPFAMPTAAASRFSVTVRYRGAVLVSHRDSVSAGERMMPVCNFDIPA